MQAIARVLRVTPILIMVAGFALTASALEPAKAADQRLDQADAFLAKAEALLKAAEDPNARARKPFGGHADRAVDAIEKARRQIAEAKEAADKGK